MPIVSRVCAFTVLGCSLATAASAQVRIPIRTIGPILATSTENVGAGVTVRATTDGHVIVGAGARQRVYVFDSTLASFTLVVDSASGTGTMAPRAMGLIAYLGDSTLLPDLGASALAIVRVRDYHIDWVDPDGSKRSSPKMPFDWRRYTDAERRQRADSLRRVVEEGLSKSNALRPPEQGRYKVDFNIVPDSELPTFWPPVQPGAVLADLDGHVWILPTTSTNAANGFTYDVVNRAGEIVERVQLPKDHVLVGFGPRNIVYLSNAEGKNTYLVRALLTGPPK